MALLAPEVPDVARLEDFIFWKYHWHWIPQMAARHLLKQIPYRLVLDLANRYLSPHPVSIDTLPR
jgi:hypothetical protein